MLRTILAVQISNSCPTNVKLYLAVELLCENGDRENVVYEISVEVLVGGRTMGSDTLEYVDVSTVRRGDGYAAQHHDAPRLFPSHRGADV